MTFLKRHFVAVVFGAVTVLTAPCAIADTDPVRLSAEQMRLAADLNMRNGQIDVALSLTDALLKRDPEDVTALMIRAFAMRAKAEYAAAQKAARAAWQASKTDDQKYAAALLMAQALSSDGKRTRAQLWLRRAGQVAPSKAHEARAAQDFRYVQQRNPWQTNLSFTLQPSSNINNGSSRDSSSLYYVLDPIFGGNELTLGAASKALSGLETGFNVQSRYRFFQTERTAHDLRMGLSYRTYQLSSSSKKDLAAEDADRIGRGQSPLGLEGSDFAFGTVQLGYGFKKMREDQRGEFSATADIGQSFYGGARYNSFLRASVGQSYYLNPQSKLSFGLNADIRNAQRGSDQEKLTLSAGLSKKLADQNGLYLGISASALASDTASYEYEEVSLRSGYLLGREVMGTSLQFGLSTSFRNYDVSPHDKSGRQDFQISADLTATFKNIDYMGFNPKVSLSASKTDSNIGLYDVNTMGLSIGIASSF
ncbi:hypothetical protein GGR95_001172 [Sulfitobacter undariae]|uniref:Surface lipoprotein assembly modifier C-terminal domain-containing protein n=1 Tax=Sulfitobacter undariae TaxID=1563671 RepID=A0A7W6GZ48_9RHOB|nr:surface lipoprotein assembly modifier [Sulfitobacter undariae]MBB3993541.1 hypothetical protein [Sulfitobacter undariae]